MRDLLAKVIRMFHQPEPTKLVESWPFPPVSAEPKECCGKCTKPAKKTVAKKKPAVKKPAVKKAKK